MLNCLSLSLSLSLSLLIAHSALSFHPIPVISLLIPTSFCCTLSPQVFQNFLCHTLLTLPVVSGFFDCFPSFLLCFYLFHSALHSSIFLLFLIFPLLHWHTHFSDSISLRVFFFFFSLQHSVSILHSSLPSILSSNFADVFPAFTLSLFLLHSSLTMSHYLASSVQRTKTFNNHLKHLHILILFKYQFTVSEGRK
jgi:hypothetical protein